MNAGNNSCVSELEVKNLTVRFGPAEVLTNLTFSVERGSSLAIIGPNGSGKTVLFKALIGSIPHEGSISWRPGIKLGYVPQKLDIERDLPICGRDFLGAKVAVYEASMDDVFPALSSVGLSQEILRLSIGSMSGGQFQRLLVAFALIGSPDILMLDEPAAGVDEPGQEQLNETIHRLQRDRGVTVLLISHDLSLVYRYATNVLCLSKAHPFFGPPQTVLTPEVLKNLYGTPMALHVHGHAGS